MPLENHQQSSAAIFRARRVATLPAAINQRKRTRCRSSTPRSISGHRLAEQPVPPSGDPLHPGGGDRPDGRRRGRRRRHPSPGLGFQTRPKWRSRRSEITRGRFAIMGSLPLDQPESRARIAGWRDQPGMLGLRYTFLHDPARRWLADARSTGSGLKPRPPCPIATLATDSLADLGRIAQRHPA